MRRTPSRARHALRTASRQAGVCACALLFACLMSAEREAERGREVAEQVAVQVGLVEDEALVAYVTEVGQRVAAQSPRQNVTYTFHVVDIEEPNAFALPGGYVYVSRGLLALCNGEAELANVLGHEIAHVAAHHAAERQTRAAGVGLVLLPAAVGGALLSSVLGVPGDLVNAAVNAPLQMLGTGVIAAYSRDQEREADEVGQAMAARAGIDPRGLADFMVTLEAYEKLQTGEARRPSFFDSHPMTPERVGTTSARAEELVWTREPGIAPDRAAFLAQIEGLLVGANPAEGVFQGQSFLHPDLDFIVVFPEGWKTRNGRAGVAAFAPEEDAQILLELQGRGDDPSVAAKEALAQLSRHTTLHRLESAPMQIRGLPAHRVRALAIRGRESAAVELTWVVKDGLVYRFSGLAVSGAAPRHAAALESVPASFRALQPAERGGVRELRLRVVSGRSGESLARFSDRTGNAWSERETAVANDLEEGATLQGGRLLKVAVPQPYTPRTAP